jgi:hypothetical protein
MKEKTRGRRISTILLTLVLVIGIGLLIYPPFSEYWNSFHQSRAIISYAEKVANLDKEKYEQIWSAALEYNRALTGKSNHWAMDDEEKEAYEAQLNVDGTGNMGFISIPRANINLPCTMAPTKACCKRPSATSRAPRFLWAAFTATKKTLTRWNTPPIACSAATGACPARACSAIWT